MRTNTQSVTLQRVSPPVSRAVDLSKAKGGIDSSIGSYVEVPWNGTRVRWCPDYGSNGSFMKFEGGAWKFLHPEELADLRTAVKQTPNGPAGADARDFYSALMRATKPF